MVRPLCRDDLVQNRTGNGGCLNKLEFLVGEPWEHARDKTKSGSDSLLFNPAPANPARERGTRLYVSPMQKEKAWGSCI